MSAKRSWYVLDTRGSKPYRAVGPCNNYAHADRIGNMEFGTYSLVKVTRRLAVHKYRTESTEQFFNAS
jgi:hypothetical protein